MPYLPLHTNEEPCLELRQLAMAAAGAFATLTRTWANVASVTPDETWPGLFTIELADEHQIVVSVCPVFTDTGESDYAFDYSDLSPFRSIP